jgi:hypothetical protein
MAGESGVALGVEIDRVKLARRDREVNRLLNRGGAW